MKVTKAEINKVQKLVKLCVKHLKKKQYELDLPKNAIENALNVLVVKNIKDVPSRAGANMIRINIGYWQMGNPTATEYKAFNDDPTIGQIDITDDDDHLLVMVAHEVAHHIQYRYCPNVARYRNNYRKPHGECFQAIYRYLRRDLVNPMIEARKEEFEIAA